MKNPNQVLLIDDDSITNYLNKRVIEKSGLSKEIVIALNGSEALKILTDNCNNRGICPELIFLDINMPIMSGLEFLEEYEHMDFANKPNVVLYLLTTSTHIRDMDKIKGYKVTGILNKPLTADKLDEVIQANYSSQEEGIK